jgi:heme-degrading monooxygenase HmoA
MARTHLFRQASGFVELKLLRCEDRARRYLTIDRWASATAFEDFKRLFVAEYQALDAQLEGLASTEVRVGAFEEWPFTQ